MAYEYLTMVASFITCFMMGVTLSLQPASIIVGSHTHLREQSKWTRWNGYIMCVLLLFVLDVLVTNGIYIAFHDVYGNLFNIGYLDFDPMDMFFSESFQIGVILVFSLVLFQVLGLVDLAHGERDLSFYYDQVDAGKHKPSWMEQYMGRQRGSLGVSLVGLLYMLRMTIKTMWPYIVCLVWFKILAILVNVLVSPSINRIMHADNEMTTLIIFDPYIITYVVAGFLWGHVALHHDVTKVSRLANSIAISLIPRLTVLVGAVFFIGLALAIIMVPITWDRVLDALTTK